MKKSNIFPNKAPHAHAGFTLVETMVAAAISSILLMVLMYGYNAYIRMTAMQESQAKLQQQLMQVRNIIEKDIRMSGFNLPGNGLFPMNYGSGDFKLVFLRNENNNTTGLENSAVPGDSLLYVTNVNSATSQQWVCLQQGSAIAYYQIAKISIHSGLTCDTVKLKDSTISVTWDKSVTKVYFAKAVYYNRTVINALYTLVRYASDGVQAIGPSIDSISFLPKDDSGDLPGNVFPQAKILGITLGGSFKTSNAQSRLFKTFDALIRN
jgi:prepilin-type N-terminal cleavage/methylation domain-containing protein